jgi:hypothetical protein
VIAPAIALSHAKANSATTTRRNTAVVRRGSRAASAKLGSDVSVDAAMRTSDQTARPTIAMWSGVAGLVSTENAKTAYV